MSPKVSAERKQKICQLFKDGTPVENIPAKFACDVTQHQVQDVLQKAGLFTPPEPVVADPKEEENLLYFLLQLTQAQRRPDFQEIRGQMMEFAKTSRMAIGSFDRRWYSAFLLRHVEKLPIPVALAVKSRIIEKHNKKRRQIQPKSALLVETERLRLRQGTLRELAGSLSRSGRDLNSIRQILTALRLPCPIAADIASGETSVEWERRNEIAAVVRDIVLQQRAQPVWKPKNMTVEDFEEQTQSTQLTHGTIPERNEPLQDTDELSLSGLPGEIPVADHPGDSDELEDSLLRGFSPSLMDTDLDTPPPPPLLTIPGTPLSPDSSRPLDN
ncbi:hypothetical protein BV898_14464 [Hypsibius exemplaris]|uniref:Uncharacterized protein n=1 Tax=Hypsibius exemplaris TaxID=2072580 RepID=A0A9X6N9I2_HYPEX|nr:hypothetical protein BV898_14464 [Hypsibius exemplaris]